MSGSQPRSSGTVASSPRSSAPAPTTGPLPLTANPISPGRRIFGENVAVTGYFGRRWVDDFDPADNQLTIGLEIDAYDEFALVGFEGGFIFSDDSDTTNGLSTKLDLYELYAGVRKTFVVGDGRLHPYLSTGLSYVNAKIAADAGPLDVEDDDAFGLYLRAGAYYRPTDVMRVGLDYRKLLGTHLSGTGGLDVDYDMVTLGIGVSL